MKAAFLGVLSLVTLATPPTLAAEKPKHVFACTVIEEKQKVRVKWAATDIEDGAKIRLADVAGSTEEFPIVVTPKQLRGGVYPAMSALNDQGGDIRVLTDDKKKPVAVKLFGDSDGCTLVDLVVYKNSGYTRGYVKVYGSETPEWFQKIECTHSVK